jgi:hypothetical protein
VHDGAARSAQLSSRMAEVAHAAVKLGARVPGGRWPVLAMPARGPIRHRRATPAGA